MRRWLITALLRLYPATWRSRYAEEYRALLELHPLTLRDTLDSVCGAWDAHLRGYRDGTEIAPLPRVAMLVILGAWLAFGVAGMELYSVVDDSVFVPAMRAHPAFALAWQAFAGCAVLSFAAVVTGGAVIGVSVAHNARTQRHGLLRLLIVPAVAAALCAAYVFGMVAIARRWITPPEWTGNAQVLQVNFLVGFTTLVLFAGSALASGVAIVAIIAHSEIDTVRMRIASGTRTIQPYRIARLLARVLALAMTGSTLTTLVWGLCALGDAGVAFAENSAIWLAVTLVMAAASAVAAVAASRTGAPRSLSASA